MFQPSNSLRQAVENGNADKVRGVLTGIIQADPGFRTGKLEDAVQYAENCGVSPFEEKNDPQLPMNSEETWDLVYFAASVTYLRENFTKERLDHVRRVGRKTHPEVPGPDEQVISTGSAVRGVEPSKKARGRRTSARLSRLTAVKKQLKNLLVPLLVLLRRVLFVLLPILAAVLVVVLFKKAVHN